LPVLLGHDIRRAPFVAALDRLTVERHRPLALFVDLVLDTAIGDVLVRL
jgi:hypothetical protein